LGETETEFLTGVQVGFEAELG